jgi:dolichol-phosphate mannosyltransferase
MSLGDGGGIAAPAARVSLVLPLAEGAHVAPEHLAEYRRVLADGDQSNGNVELIIASHSENGAAAALPRGDRTINVRAERPEWPALVQAGLRAATGDHVIVLDVERRYSPDSLGAVLAPIRAGSTELSVAVPRRIHPRRGLGLVSRLFLGTSDVFSGLFALRRSLWERAVHTSHTTPVLDALLRGGARCVDVPVTVANGFRFEGIGLQDLRPLKHLLDARFGNYSRLVQFCIVGASGMVVDLTLYALFQWLLSYTFLAHSRSFLFGNTSHLTVAAAISIPIALFWNFTLNRRLTFNDASKGSLLKQFITYAIGNAVAILVNFSVRLYLPAHVGFFERHRLAAAVVGIVAATSISFPMARWIVFAQRTDRRTASRRQRAEAEAVGQASGVS